MGDVLTQKIKALRDRPDPCKVSVSDRARSIDARVNIGAMPALDPEDAAARYGGTVREWAPR